MLCHGQTWPLNCARSGAWPKTVPPIRPTREEYHVCAQVRQCVLLQDKGQTKRCARALPACLPACLGPQAGRGILEPRLCFEVPLYIRDATERECVERVQRDEAVLLVKDLRFVGVRRDRPRGVVEVRLSASAGDRAARVPSCIALGGVNARNTRVDELRLVLCGAQAREDVACVVPI